MIIPRLLKHQINSEDRQYFIDKVNKPLYKAITILGMRYPEPTIINVLHPNHKKLVQIMDKYLGFEGNSRLKPLAKALFRILISKIEHSPNFRDRFSFVVEELIKCDWKTRSYNHPVNQWNEPKPYGRQI